MSTVKTDVITAVSTNGDLSLDGLGTGGVSIASTLKMTKGGDIASASPLVIDTDGNYFDVTGTTNFAAMTVEAGNFFMLQFDGALTITHGSGIELPGAANLTTAAGDRLICYATAANTVEVMSVATEAAAAAGGAYTSIANTAITATQYINFTGFASGTYDNYEVWVSNARPATDSQILAMQTSTDGGSTYDAGTSYTWVWFFVRAGTSSVGSGPGETHFSLTDGVGNDTNENNSGRISIYFPEEAQYTAFTWVFSTTNASGASCSINGVGERKSAADVDAIRFYWSSGNFVAQGKIQFFGIAQ